MVKALSSYFKATIGLNHVSKVVSGTLSRITFRQRFHNSTCSFSIILKHLLVKRNFYECKFPNEIREKQITFFLHFSKES